MIGEHLDELSYEKLMAEALAMAPDTVDKRQGSIIYDTLAVGDAQLAQGYVQLKGYCMDTYVLTAQGEYLDLRAQEVGLSRKEATRTVKKGEFTTREGEPASVPIGARFSTSQDTRQLVYTVTGVHTAEGSVVPGAYQLTCETPGLVGNDYTGSLLPLDYRAPLGSAELSELLVSGSDTESDETLRQRYLDAVNRSPFGGNIAHYRQWVLEMDGVGAVQVFPVWRGGGTVKVTILGGDYNVASPTLIQQVQNALDPPPNQGLGLGLAPIGHTVTVDTPIELAVDVEANVTLMGGAPVEGLRPQIEAAVSQYLADLRRQFGTAGDVNGYTINIYRARIAAAMMAVPGVENVTGLLLNGEDDDLMLLETAREQYLPVDGTVTLHAV